MKRIGLSLVAAAAIVLSISAVRPAIAYFTDTVETSGKFDLKIGDGKPGIDEKVEGMTKSITIKNTGDYDIFVRAKAIAPETCTLTPQLAEGWSKGDGDFYYYSKPVSPGEATETELKIHITSNSDYDFNVVIVQEATKVLYDEAGNPSADWNAKISRTQQEAPATEVQESDTTPAQ
ncbi:hypothetical protein [Pseudobutyrivibrio xylanivorans]|uniref:SipW-cognate class signal peptide n=1 Tax=Pseudobutyrivibrio xylanivorans TaxID=185007 RepID=A0A5P6VMF3_PSEXY|nr:hypothetical protein [Pseudobutyrivibrio xylanivorans]QFJ53600.1 hypothetical protein FXF36_01310 [Pseudobutyrivibrio xylanivorans]